MNAIIRNNLGARAFRSGALIAMLLITLNTQAKAGFWCEAGCYASYAVSEIGCGLGWVGDSIICVWDSASGFIDGTLNQQGFNASGGVSIDGGGLADCMSAVANSNASGCSSSAWQDLDSCLAG